MSILGGISQTDAIAYAVLAFISLVVLAVAAALGAFRRGAVIGPERAASSAGWPLLVMLFAGLVCWLGGQGVIGAIARQRWQHSGTTRPFDMSSLTPVDYAMLATIPGIVGALAIVLTALNFKRDRRPVLGMSPALIPSGVVKGFLAILVVMPIILWVSLGTELVYDVVGFKHPAEHDLLKVMKSGETPLVRVALIAGAVAVAPVVEELLFRGLFQTLIGWMLGRLIMPAPVAGGFPVVTDEPAASEPAPVVDAGANVRKHVRVRWLAIVIASLMFAGVHPAWSIPPIFVLSICLGYLYERTGNLWANITLHALFNGFQTFYYFYGVT